MKRIGILGGLGPESTIAYYSYITRTYYERFADYAYPEIIIYSLKFDDYIGKHYKMIPGAKAAIEALARAGADFVVAACNSIHVIYDELAPQLPIPWISIVEAAAEKIQAESLRKVALLGTVYTMSADFYPKGLAKYSIETITPDSDAQQKINEIIYGELVRAEVKDESREFVLKVIDELKQHGAEGIVLGCTELPFLITQDHTPLPVFDTTAIHAQKALDIALED